jgi:hypothetical protein
MNSLTVDHKSIALINPNESVKQSISPENIVKKISSIDALQIELIGHKIAEKIVNNLGPVGKAKVAQKINPKQKASEMTMMLMIQTMMHARMDMEQGKQFLSEEEAFKFVMLALWPIKDKITDSFSKPDWFLEYGLYFQLSDYEPMGVLSETAEKMGLNITLNDVPSKYYIYLKLDKELTNEKSDLVFVLTEKSNNVEFSKKTFTIKELEQEFNSSLH